MDWENFFEAICYTICFHPHSPKITFHDRFQKDKSNPELREVWPKRGMA